MMADEFSAWLALREPADAAARSAAVTHAVLDRIDGIEPLRVLDLGAGTGANLRFLGPRIPVNQQWLLVDRNAALLEEVAAITPSLRTRCDVETRRLDLETLDAAIFLNRHLVTASALLDLVSEAWLTELAVRTQARGAAVLFALTYDGRSRCSPAEPEDDVVRELFNRHQKAQRGIGGPAAGPDAVDCAERAFVAAGYRTQRAASDWVLPPEAHALQRRLIEGWAAPAVEMEPGLEPTLRDWLRRRLGHVREGRSQIIVGHEDFAAWRPS
jgi:hypothetical protein